MPVSQLTEDGNLPSSASGPPIQRHSLVHPPNKVVSMSSF